MIIMLPLQTLIWVYYLLGDRIYSKNKALFRIGLAGKI